MARFLPSFLPTPHVLLEPIQGSRLFFGMSVRFSPFIELPINKLPLVHNIAKGLSSILIESNLVAHVVFQYLGPEFLLELVDLEALEVAFGPLSLFFILEFIFFDQLL